MHPTARLLVSFLAIVFTSMLVDAQQIAKKIPYPVSPDSIIGFLEFRPPDYGSQLHPLIIFLHGRDERGNGGSQINSLKANGIPRYCANGAAMKFMYDGKPSSFVVLSPQLSMQYGSWPVFYVKEMIKYAKANLQIDTNRIYVTGLSLGGGGVWAAISESVELTNSIAAAAPVCGTQEMNDGNFCKTVGATHLPVWAFHSIDDKTVRVDATQHGEILGEICKLAPVQKITYYQLGGHAQAWINAYDTGHITVKLKGGIPFTAKPNLYEWFLANTRAMGKNIAEDTAAKKSVTVVEGKNNKKFLSGFPGWFKKQKDCFDMFAKAAIIPYTAVAQ
jgi:predicted peptidase